MSKLDRFLQEQDAGFDKSKYPKEIYIIHPAEENDRIAYGLLYLSKRLAKNGYYIHNVDEKDITDLRQFNALTLYAGDRNNSKVIKDLEENKELLYYNHAPEGEGFYLHTLPGQVWLIVGGSDIGTLYGCVALSERVMFRGGLPRNMTYGDAPVFKLRGPAIGLQLTKIEPPRNTYEYPITPDRFPWFYDKNMWIRTMEMMVEMRCNVLYLWSGHPFASLVKLKDYPEALEVTEEEYQMNREIFTWLAEECHKRGIWVVLKFYNIHISYPFAVAHGLDLLQNDINPLVADYTYKSIVEFIKSFPNIGLMVCLGEALRGQQNKTDWFLNTILPAVKEGVKEAGLDHEPPLILRGHDCDADTILTAATKQYSNLYTMWKYNGESLTTYFPTGNWQEIHQHLSSHGQPHIMNVHILANLEPFRFGSPRFIQKSMQAGRERLGANGLHLYPMFFWDWPYSPDKVEPRYYATQRDWLWYKAWFRYAWNPNRGERGEQGYWRGVLAEHFGCNQEVGQHVLDAIEYAGECAPRILRRVGITEGNRQTLSLGMLMTQFTHVSKYRPNVELWKSASTPGETPDEYVERELKGERHWGETPLDMVEEVRYYADSAYDLIRAMQPNITRCIREYGRFVTDIQAIRLMSHSYCKKIEAAIKIITYKNTMDKETLKGDLTLLREAEGLMKESLDFYRELTALTSETYLYANSMQTPQRKIPFPDGDAYGHWSQCLPEYEKEYENFAKHVTEMENGIYPKEEEVDLSAIEPLRDADYTILSTEYEPYTIEKGARVFTDEPRVIQNCAPEITGLTGLRMNKEEAHLKGAPIEIDCHEDCQVLIGYFKSKGKNNPWLKVPELETDTHADDRGGLAVVYGEAMKIAESPVVNVHAFRYEKGKHRIYLGNGAFVFVGVVPASIKLVPRAAGLAKETLDMLDWMFEK